MNTSKSFIPPWTLANRLGLPVAWIRSEAKAGRIPHIRVGRRLMFNLDDVERSLRGRQSVEAERREMAPC